MLQNHCTWDTPVQSKPAKMTKIFGFLFNLQQSGEDKTFPSLGWKPTTMTFFAHLSLPWSIVLVALSFLGCCRRRPTMVTPDQISTLFNIYRHKSIVLTQFHLISSSTKLHWPSTTKYQPVPPNTDPVPPITNQYRLLLTPQHFISYSNIRLSFVHLRWAQSYVSLVFCIVFCLILVHGW